MKLLFQWVVVALLSTFVQEMSQKPQVSKLIKFLDVCKNSAASLKFSIRLLSDIGLQIFEKPWDTVSRVYALKQTNFVNSFLI